jgi:Carboxypeptidase regulatory-like domain
MKTLLLTCLFITLSALCFASEKSPCTEEAFSGIVIDASGKPMADVVIVAKGASSQQRVITDEQGQFKISCLPEGTYTLRFEKINYKPVEKKNMVVAKNNSSKLNVQLLPDESKDENCHSWLLKIDFM